MSNEPLTTMQKAFNLNMDLAKYGTIAEIGAGQEVSRFFFRAGGAAGTIAKTISAYDMDFSDAIYGKEEDHRYVTESRVKKMLDKEFRLVLERVGYKRPKNSTYFAFADTITAKSYSQKSECHGWLGIKLQLSSGAEPCEILLHVRMLDESNLMQQEAVGILGVNLIYGAFYHYTDIEKLIRSLGDNLEWGRLEIDAFFSCSGVPKPLHKRKGGICAWYSKSDHSLRRCLLRRAERRDSRCLRLAFRSRNPVVCLPHA